MAPRQTLRIPTTGSQEKPVRPRSPEEDWVIAQAQGSPTRHHSSDISPQRIRSIPASLWLMLPQTESITATRWQVQYSGKYQIRYMPRTFSGIFQRQLTVM